MTNEMMRKAKECKSAEELLALARENNYPMSEEEAERLFGIRQTEGELADTELDNVSGGGCSTAVGEKKYIVVTAGCGCFTGQYEAAVKYAFMGKENIPMEVEAADNEYLRRIWAQYCGYNSCGSCKKLAFKGGLGYCSVSGN